MQVFKSFQSTLFDRVLSLISTCRGSVRHFCTVCVQTIQLTVIQFWRFPCTSTSISIDVFYALVQRFTSFTFTNLAQFCFDEMRVKVSNKTLCCLSPLSHVQICSHVRFIRLHTPLQKVHFSTRSIRSQNHYTSNTELHARSAFSKEQYILKIIFYTCGVLSTEWNLQWLSLKIFQKLYVFITAPNHLTFRTGVARTISERRGSGAHAHTIPLTQACTIIRSCPWMFCGLKSR